MMLSSYTSGSHPRFPLPLPLPRTSSSTSTTTPPTTSSSPSLFRLSRSLAGKKNNSNVGNNNNNNNNNSSDIPSSTPIVVEPAATVSQRCSDSKHAESKSKTNHVQPVIRSIPRSTATTDTTTTSSSFDTDMVKRSLSPTIASPNAVDNLAARPPTPTTTRTTTTTSPVQIPKQTNRNRHFQTPQPVRRCSSNGSFRRRVPGHVHSPESLSPSVAALLANTDIPRQRKPQKKPRKADRPLTVDEIISGEKQLSEKELSWTFSRGSPMDVLLSPPESLDEDYVSGSDCHMGCSMVRTLSVDSMPSLGDSFVTDAVSSIGSPRSPSPTSSSRRRMMSPIRKSLEPVRSPPDSIDEHPLAAKAHDAEELDFVALQKPDSDDDSTPASPLLPFKPLRAAFKSNLTASLRALRSAAKSFSSINFPSIPPDDLLTRSLLTMDPKVPYVDERRPPVTEEMPSAELRRYLNPSTRLSQPGTLQAPGTFAASIQMQTYKIQRSRPTSSSAGRSPYPPTSPQSPSPAASDQSPSKTPSQGATTSSSSSSSPSPPPRVPAMRQREMRENPDFIRIAVMEMAMRRRGKLDNQKAGRARWALPPRKASSKTYEIGADGVPERWIPITY